MSDPKWKEFKSDSKNYFITANWEARAETPDEIAARFLRMIDSLKEIDPVFGSWTWIGRRPQNLEEVRDSLAAEIITKVVRNDWKKPVPQLGYSFGALTRDTPKARSFTVSCHAGSYVKDIFGNSLVLSTNEVIGSRPDPHVVSYRIFRLALLAIVEAWDPVIVGAKSHPLVNLKEYGSYFSLAWIRYLCPWLAGKITPPSTVLAEHLPNGGLLMTATTETFDVDNPAHLSAARDMAAATAPLDHLPWPSQR